jgi:hypothetical protein
MAVAQTRANYALLSPVPQLNLFFFFVFVLVLQ